MLVRHGLKRIDRVWIAAEELRLRQDLAELPKRRERILALERDLDERIEANRKLWLEAQPAIAALRKSLAKFGTDDPQRVLIQQQLDALLAASAEPAKLGGRGEVRSRVVRWIDERNGLATAVGADSQPSPAWRACTSGWPKRPASPKLSAAPAKSTASARTAAMPPKRTSSPTTSGWPSRPWVPIFFQGSQVRLTALINDQSPVTFTWSDSSGPGIVLTRTAAEAAGLTIPATARAKWSRGRPPSGPPPAASRSSGCDWASASCSRPRSSSCLPRPKTGAANSAAKRSPGTRCSSSPSDSASRSTRDKTWLKFTAPGVRDANRRQGACGGGRRRDEQACGGQNQACELQAAGSRTVACRLAAGGGRCQHHFVVEGQVADFAGQGHFGGEFRRQSRELAAGAGHWSSRGGRSLRSVGRVGGLGLLGSGFRGRGLLAQSHFRSPITFRETSLDVKRTVHRLGANLATTSPLAFDSPRL